MLAGSVQLPRGMIDMPAGDGARQALECQADKARLERFQAQAERESRAERPMTRDGTVWESPYSRFGGKDALTYRIHAANVNETCFQIMACVFRFAAAAGTATILSLGLQSNALAASFSFVSPTDTSATSASVSANGTTFTLSNPQWTGGVTNGIRRGTAGVCAWAVVGTLANSGRCDVNVGATNGSGFSGAELTGFTGVFNRDTVLRSFTIGQFAPAAFITGAQIKFKVGATVLETVNPTAAGFFNLTTPITLAAGQNLEIITSGSSSAPNGAVIRISSFEADASVPGPLPLLGASAAFGWSRQLRRRIQAKAG